MFDGAARRVVQELELCSSLLRSILPYSFVLVDLCSNNVAEHQTLILGLKMVIGMGIKDLNVYGDSQLVIN